MNHREGVQMAPQSVRAAAVAPWMTLWAAVVAQALDDATEEAARLPWECDERYRARIENRGEAHRFLFSAGCQRIIESLGLDWEVFEQKRDAALQGAMQ